MSDDYLWRFTCDTCGRWFRSKKCGMTTCYECQGYIYRETCSECGKVTLSKTPAKDNSLCLGCVADAMKREEESRRDWRVRLDGNEPFAFYYDYDSYDKHYLYAEDEHGRPIEFKSEYDAEEFILALKRSLNPLSQLATELHKEMYKEDCDDE